MAACSSMNASLAFITLVFLLSSKPAARAADPCPGGTSSVVYKLASCLPATKNADVAVADACCNQIMQMSGMPDCLCSCVTSREAKYMGVKPMIALTIPKRCGITSRPVGYQCAGSTLPQSSKVP